MIAAAAEALADSGGRRTQKKLKVGRTAPGQKNFTPGFLSIRRRRTRSFERGRKKWGVAKKVFFLFSALLFGRPGKKCYYSRRSLSLTIFCYFSPRKLFRRRSCSFPSQEKNSVSKRNEVDRGQQRRRRRQQPRHRRKKEPLSFVSVCVCPCVCVTGEGGRTRLEKKALEAKKAAWRRTKERRKKRPRNKPNVRSIGFYIQSTNERTHNTHTHTWDSITSLNSTLPHLPDGLFCAHFCRTNGGGTEASLHNLTSERIIFLSQILPSLARVIIDSINRLHSVHGRLLVGLLQTTYLKTQFGIFCKFILRRWLLQTPNTKAYSLTHIPHIHTVTKWTHVHTRTYVCMYAV